MYRLQPEHQNLWCILDERDEQVFRGTLAECEAWLDLREFHARFEHRGSASLVRWMDRWHHWLMGSGDSPWPVPQTPEPSRPSSLSQR